MKKPRTECDKNSGLERIVRAWERRKREGTAPDFVDTLSDGTEIEVTRLSPDECEAETDGEDQET